MSCLCCVWPVQPSKPSWTWISRFWTRWSDFQTLGCRDTPALALRGERSHDIPHAWWIHVERSGSPAVALLAVARTAQLVTDLFTGWQWYCTSVYGVAFLVCTGLCYIWPSHLWSLYFCFICWLISCIFFISVLLLRLNWILLSFTNIRCTNFFLIGCIWTRFSVFARSFQSVCSLY